MNKLVRFLGTGALMSSPFLALAQGTYNDGGNLFNILGIISGLLNTIIPILITLAVVYVIWGVIQYATAKDSDKQAEGRKTIVSGIIALFVIVSIWGLVALLNNTFGVDQGGTQEIQIDCPPGGVYFNAVSGTWDPCPA